MDCEVAPDMPEHLLDLYRHNSLDLGLGCFHKTYKISQLCCKYELSDAGRAGLFLVVCDRFNRSAGFQIILTSPSQTLTSGFPVPATVIAM